MKSDKSKKIERYLRGGLSEAERTDLEKNLAADPALQRELHLQKAEIEVMQQVTAVRVAEKIRHWQRQKKKRERAFGLAGAGLVILLLGWLFWKKGQLPAAQPSQPPVARDTVFREMPQQQPNSPAPKRDFPDKKTTAAPSSKAVAEALKLADPPIFRRKFLSGENSASQRDSLVGEAEAAWNRADFAQSLAVLDVLGARFPEFSNRWNRLRGTVLLRAKQAEAAATAFEKIERDSPDRAQVEWNLLLAYFSAGPPRRVDFERLFSKILATPNHPAHQKARGF